MTYWPLEDAEHLLLPVPQNAVEAVQHAAVRYAGLAVSRAAAEKIARHVLECADEHYRVRRSLVGEMWDRQEIRDNVREHLRTQLFVGLARKRLLPVAWPRERVLEVAGMGGGVVDVELVVPVRRVIP